MAGLLEQCKNVQAWDYVRKIFNLIYRDFVRRYGGKRIKRESLWGEFDSAETVSH